MVSIFTSYPEELTLLHQIAAGEKSALTWLYKHCFPTTEKMVLKMNGNYDDAWDVYQEAVTILYQKASVEGISLNCRINTFITSIAKNLWLKKLKQIQKHYRPFDNEFDTVDTTNEVDTYIEKEKELAQLNEALEKLGEPCASILRAFYFNDKSMQEITQQFGYTNADNAKTQKYKCLTRLKKIFFKDMSNVE